MKKVITFLILFLIPLNVLAEEKKEVKFASCVDGDTANIIIDNEEVKIRFLAVDTPETKHPTKGEEPYGKEASEYTCNTLKNASKIEIEYDSNSDKMDKYNRHLVWIFVDGNLLQEELIELGYAKTAYLYDDYKYTSSLEEIEEIAKNSKVGMWGNEDNSISNIEIIIIIVIIIIFILFFIFNKNFRKKTLNKTKREVKNKIKQEFKDLLG